VILLKDDIKGKMGEKSVNQKHPQGIFENYYKFTNDIYLKTSILIYSNT